jgi:phospholipid/cholesterol/gamma-HCH transport system permease protein
MPVPITASGWLVRPEGDTSIVVLRNDWTSTDATAESLRIVPALERAGLKAIGFETQQLARWDSSLLVFVSALKVGAARKAIRVDESGLPAAARDLLKLLVVEIHPPAPRVPRSTLREWLGRWALSQGALWDQSATLVGEQILGTTAWVRGRAKLRVTDLFRCLQDAGIGALPMVALVNLMVGGILAFVGIVQLRRFGASIYVADLVGVGVVREMAPLMTAIVMSGRTGSAYAAELATMQGSDQIDALRAFGIPIYDYLILPRVTVLTAMMPLLYIYGSAIGISGGFAVAVIMLRLSPQTFVSELRGAVTGAEMLFGLSKSIVFGAWIGLVACRIGLDAGRGTNDVGAASTRAAVQGIAGVIVLDALFAACANAWGI